MWQREIKRCGGASHCGLKLKCCLSFCRCQCGVCVILLAQCKWQLLLLLLQQLQLLPHAAAATAVCNYEQSALITDTNNNGGGREREKREGETGREAEACSPLVQVIKPRFMVPSRQRALSATASYLRATKLLPPIGACGQKSWLETS